VGLPVQDEVGRPRGGAVRVRLAVLDQEFDRMSLAADRDSVLERLLEASEDELVGLAEAGERARPRADVADLDLALCAARGPGTQRAQTGDRGRATLDEPPSCSCARNQPLRVARRRFPHGALSLALARAAHQVT